MNWTGVYVLFDGTTGKDTRVWTTPDLRLGREWLAIVELPNLIVHEWNGTSRHDPRHARLWIFVPA